MTNWLPDLSGGAGPLYQRLADRIESDIDHGVLEHGTKLPPQRDLAFDIQTTVGTVGRAYSLLRKRGLVSGEVGRGTYVTGQIGARPVADNPLTFHTEDARQFGTRALDLPPEKVRFDSTSAPDIGQGATIGRVLGEAASAAPTELSNYTRTFPDHWFEAGRLWLTRNGFSPEADMIVPTLGTHAGVMATIAALTSAGDYVVFEHATYSPIARSANHIGRRILLVDSDEQGMDPASFDHICAQKHPKMAFLMPTAHNPTVSIMPEQRRRAIADIARKHNVLLIEDDLYGSLSGDPTPLVAEFAPERTIVASGLSKAVAAGIRGGWIACPRPYRHRIRVAHKMLSGGLPYILTEASARLVLGGEADRIRAASIQEINLRMAMVHEALDGYRFNAHPNIPFIWLALPEAWNSGTFKNAALERGVAIDDEDEFKAGRSEKTFHCVRIGVSAPLERETVRQSLETLRRLLDEGPVGYEQYE